MTLLELHTQRRKAKKEAAALLDTATAESRGLTVTEQVRFDTLMGQMHELDTAIAERENLRRLVQ